MSHLEINQLFFPAKSVRFAPESLCDLERILQL